MGVVYGMRAFTKDDVERVDHEVTRKERLGMTIKGKAEKVREIINTFYNTPEVLDAPDFSAQTTRINYRIWPHLFKQTSQKKTEEANGLSRVPDLIYLEIESLVSELLIRYHLHNPASLIHRLIFNPTYRALALKYFNNIAGAFSLDNKW